MLNDEVGSGFNFIDAVKMKIKLKGGKFTNVDGEAAGYLINNFHLWREHEESLFYSLDGYSQLLYHLHYFIFERSYLSTVMTNGNKKNMNDFKVLFLNRIYCEENTIKNHQYFLQTLQESFDFIIYSFGTTDLDDDDFPEDYTDDFCKDVEEKILTKHNGWSKDMKLNFYLWNKTQ